MRVSSDWIVIIEGKAKIAIPNPAKYVREDRVIEPTWAPIFYNPLMVMNRDIAILILLLVAEKRGNVHAADVLAGTGVRAIRFCIEVNGINSCIANDISREAYELIKHNANLNGVSDLVKVYNEDANILLYTLLKKGIRLTYIDIDPFGSPVPFIRSALSNIADGGTLGITATDTAPLSGSRWWAGARRYDVYLVKNDIGDEVGLRVLLGYIARRAAEDDKYVKPLLSYSHKHYYRIYVEVLEGAREADKMLNNCLGFIAICEKSGYKAMIKGKKPLVRFVRCPEGGEASLIGPLWVCKLNDDETMNKLSSIIKSYRYLQTYTYIKSLIKSIAQDNIEGIVFNLATISRYLKCNIPNLESLLTCLSNLGYKASRPYYRGHYVRTNASWNDLINCMLST